jgi:hypothetical protein
MNEIIKNIDFAIELRKTQRWRGAKNRGRLDGLLVARGVLKTETSRQVKINYFEDKILADKSFYETRKDDFWLGRIEMFEKVIEELNDEL